MTEAVLRDFADRLSAFEQAARELLLEHETSQKTRVMTLSSSYEDVTSLNMQQEELLKQALRCAEHGLYRAAHVMAWAAYVSFLKDKLSSDGLVKLRSLRSNWQGSDIDEMAENYTEHAFLEAARALGLLSKADLKALAGDLSKRNECAHPSGYLPGLNETLGYVSGLLSRMRKLNSKSL